MANDPSTAAGAAAPYCEYQSGHEYATRWTPELAQTLANALGDTYRDGTGINHLDGRNMPQSEEIIHALDDLLELLFPGYSGRIHIDRANLGFVVGAQVNDIFRRLVEQIERAYAYNCRVTCCSTGNCRHQAEDAVIRLLQALPRIRETLKGDVQAAVDGDPATSSPDEVVIAYPGLKAVAINRVAHVLYQAGVPLIPRVMGEHAHALTGIDIHPGATLGANIFIDHGTGVVIGETCTIGANVKIYQGVTLGALSFPKDACGRIIKGAKRHPNIEDNVTLYAGATVLGDITIGHDSIIGGNVWITEGVPPYTKVTVAPPELSIRTRKTT